MMSEWKGGQKAAQKRYREKNKERRAAYNKLWYAKNREREKKKRHTYYLANKEKIHKQNRAWYRRYRKSLKANIVRGYGGKCNCCGEKEIKFMEVDHIYNDGNKDRKRFAGPQQFYIWLVKNNFPKKNYQLLCANCNKGKARNEGICPHKTNVL